METVSAGVKRLRLAPGTLGDEGDAVETVTAVGERLSLTPVTRNVPWKR